MTGKERALRATLSSLGSVVVAYSGGVDSAYLAYVANDNTSRINKTSCYQDNRYWTMYKLPMFGCTDSSQVLKEIGNATKSFPNAYIRLVAFDPNRQVQVAGMLVHRPPSCDEYRQPSDRSV